MAFRTNSYQQLSFTDSFGGLTSREKKALEHSWAKVFAEDIFPVRKPGGGVKTPPYGLTFTGAL